MHVDGWLDQVLCFDTYMYRSFKINLKECERGGKLFVFLWKWWIQLYSTMIIDNEWYRIGDECGTKRRKHGITISIHHEWDILMGNKLELVENVLLWSRDDDAFIYFCLPFCRQCSLLKFWNQRDAKVDEGS